VDSQGGRHTNCVEVVKFGHPESCKSRMKVVGELCYLTRHNAPNEMAMTGAELEIDLL